MRNNPSCGGVGPLPTEPRVAVIVLNWNGREDTLECLRSIRSIAYSNFGVIVVDNGSTDGSVAAIRASQPSVEVIDTGENLGFAGGNNVGIRRALELGADYVLLLNNDTVVDPGLLRAFVAAAALHPEAGAFGAKIYFHSEPTRIWYAGARWEAGAGELRSRGLGASRPRSRILRDAGNGLRFGLRVVCARIRVS